MHFWQTKKKKKLNNKKIKKIEKKRKVQQSKTKPNQKLTVPMDTRGKSRIYFQDLFNSSSLHYNTSLKAAFTKTYLPSKSERQALPLNFNTS